MVGGNAGGGGEERGKERVNFLFLSERKEKSNFRLALTNLNPSLSHACRMLSSDSL